MNVSAGKSKKKRRVFYELPVGQGFRSRCPCHYMLPCPRAAAKKKE